MPKGVICGGAADGSNQLGEIVTCHAITAWPAGSAMAERAATAAQATASAASGRRQRRPINAIIIPPPTAADAALYRKQPTRLSAIPARRSNTLAPGFRGHFGWGLLPRRGSPRSVE